MITLKAFVTLFLLGIILVLVSVLVMANTTTGSVIVPSTSVAAVIGNRSSRITVVVFGFEPLVSTREFQHSYPSDRVRYVDFTEPYTVDEHTIALVINQSTHKDLDRFKSSQIIGLAWEPSGSFATSFLTPEYQEFVERRFARYHVSSLQNIKPTCTKFKPYLQFHPIGTPIPSAHLSIDDWWTRKPHTLSIILSPKQYLPGHKYRHTLCREMIRRNLPVHIYGGGSNQYKPFAGVRGPFKPAEAAEPYRDYKFHITIENSREDHYVTEKYLQPLAQHCIPIYYGAQKLADYFGPQAAHTLTGDLQTDMTFLTNLCENPRKYYLDLTEARTALLAGKANFAHMIEHEFDSS